MTAHVPFHHHIRLTMLPLVLGLGPSHFKFTVVFRYDRDDIISHGSSSGSSPSPMKAYERKVIGHTILSDAHPSGRLKLAVCHFGNESGPLQHGQGHVVEPARDRSINATFGVPDSSQPSVRRDRDGIVRTFGTREGQIYLVDMWLGVQDGVDVPDRRPGKFVLKKQASA